MTTKPFYHWEGDDLYLVCHLQPKAKKDEFCGLYGASLKIRITAPPVDGKANAHLMKFIAKHFGVAKSKVEIIRGEMSREKQLCIHGPDKFPKELDIKQP